MAQTNEESWTNVLENAVMPVDVRKTTQVGGAAFYVALETLVDYMARRVFKTARRSVKEIAAIHALSLPFIGGLGVLAAKEDAKGLKADIGQQFMEGAKGIPAVFTSAYIVNTYMDGLHLPRLDFKDILITAASKIATRPLMSFIYPMNESIQNGQDALGAAFALQRRQVRFGADE